MRGPGPYASKGEQESKRKSLKLILEKKLAILEKAIESNPSNVDLKLARLKLCAEFWEPPALIKEWQKLIFLHPNNPEMWKKYLLFCQSQFTTFSVSKINSLYGKCLTTLAAVQDGSMVSHPLLPGTEEAMLGKVLLHVMVRLVFMGANCIENRFSYVLHEAFLLFKMPGILVS